jgi:thioredoxin-related protein
VLFRKKKGAIARPDSSAFALAGNWCWTLVHASLNFALTGDAIVAASQVRTVCRTMICAHTRPGTLEILFPQTSPVRPSYASNVHPRKREMDLSRRLCALFFALTLAGCEVGTESTGSQTADSRQTATEDAWASADNRIARGNLRFVEGYRQGYEKALRDGKPMFVFFTAEWCNFCHQMAEEAFTHPQVVALSGHFVCILVDADAEPEVCKQFHVQGYPTIQFLSPRGVPMNRIKGKQPGAQLITAMQAALQNVARRTDANLAKEVR